MDKRLLETNELDLGGNLALEGKYEVFDSEAQLHRITIARTLKIQVAAMHFAGRDPRSISADLSLLSLLLSDLNFANRARHSDIYADSMYESNTS